MGAEPCLDYMHMHTGRCARAGYRHGYAQALADVQALADAENSTATEETD